MNIIISITDDYGAGCETMRFTSEGFKNELKTDSQILKIITDVELTLIEKIHKKCKYVHIQA